MNIDHIVSRPVNTMLEFLDWTQLRDRLQTYCNQSVAQIFWFDYLTSQITPVYTVGGNVTLESINYGMTLMNQITHGRALHIGIADNGPDIVIRAIPENPATFAWAECVRNEKWIPGWNESQSILSEGEVEDLPLAIN